MTRIEQLEKQQAAIEAERKRVNKALAAARRRETAKAAQEQRAKEQAEAVAFLAYCRAKVIQTQGGDMTVYEFVQGLIEADRANEEQGKDTKP